MVSIYPIGSTYGSFTSLDYKKSRVLMDPLRVCYGHTIHPAVDEPSVFFGAKGTLDRRKTSPKKNAFPHLQDLVPDVLRRGDRMNDSTSWGVAKPQAKEMEGPKTSSLKMNQTWKETIPGIQENNPKSWLRKCFSQKHSSFWGSHVEKNRPHHVHLQWPWIRGFFFTVSWPIGWRYGIFAYMWFMFYGKCR